MNVGDIKPERMSDDGKGLIGHDAGGEFIVWLCEKCGINFAKAAGNKKLSRWMGELTHLKCGGSVSLHSVAGPAESGKE